MRKKRIFVIGHGDLDGITGIMGVKMAHPNDHVIVRTAMYDNVDKMLLDALRYTKDPYDRIVLVDIAFNPNVGGEFEDVETRWLVKHNLPEAVYDYTRAGGELVVLDHHPRALELKDSIYMSRLHEDSILEMVDDQGVKRAGSELAGRYYVKNRTPIYSDEVETVLMGIVLTMCRVNGAYDVFRKDDDFELGAKMAMTQNMMFDDSMGFLAGLESTATNMLSTLMDPRRTPQDCKLRDLMIESMPTLLAHYVRRAEALFEAEVARARSTMIEHHPNVHEIYSVHFESLVAERLYKETGGVIVIRYEESRAKTKKVSLRRSLDCPVNLTAIAKHFGGGGHPVAAGLTLKNGATIDQVNAKLVEALSGQRPDLLVA